MTKGDNEHSLQSPLLCVSIGLLFIWEFFHDCKVCSDTLNSKNTEIGKYKIRFLWNLQFYRNSICKIVSKVSFERNNIPKKSFSDVQLYVSFSPNFYTILHPIEILKNFIEYDLRSFVPKVLNETVCTIDIF